LSVRLKDIARDLGISPMAVSKALRDHKDISVETRERVRRRAAELNYRIDLLARGLRAGQTYLVGLVVPDLMQSFFAEIATAVAATLVPSGYHIVISHTRENVVEEKAQIDLLVSRKVDGLIIASAELSARHLQALKTPYVLIDRRLRGLKADFVGADDAQIGTLATEHLIKQGCRRLVHLKGPPLSTSAGRARGFNQTLRRHHLGMRKEWVVDAGHGDAGGYIAMKGLLARKVRPDGVFCFNDPVAVGAMRAILEAGLSVPQDVALVGVANMRYSDVLSVPLTTVDQGAAAIGQQAAQRLLVRMKAGKAPPPKELLVPPQLIIRRSSQRRS
jgi:LacI family transcriptional regulator